SRTFRSRLEQHPPRAIPSQHKVRNGGLGQVDPHQVLLSGFNSLTDGLWNFFRFPRAIADHGRAGITDHDQSREGKVLATLHHFSDAVDRNHLILELVLPSIELLQYCWHP